MVARRERKGVNSIVDWAPTGDLLLLYNEGKVKKEDISDLGDIASEGTSPRSDSRDKVIFVTGGLAVEDVAWAYEVYQNAVNKGIGQTLELWDRPHWV
ncbi:hypothetical protein ACLIBG_13620 [Virgibacillus sp. W0181]|uniref:hypothetical protein n=1 Tax=Virgibacillus sp. W0181 TaxID=3391581 RepID=UPI003F466544